METMTDAAPLGPGTEPDAIDLSFVARLVPGLVVEDIGGDPVVIGGPARVMVLSPTAALVFQFLDGEGTLGELAAEIADALDADPEQVGDDVLLFAKQLAWNGLLEGITFPEPELPEWEEAAPRWRWVTHCSTSHSPTSPGPSVPSRSSPTAVSCS